jgi:hypothetical protein
VSIFRSKEICPTYNQLTPPGRGAPHSLGTSVLGLNGNYMYHARASTIRNCAYLWASYEPHCKQRCFLKNSINHMIMMEKRGAIRTDTLRDWFDFCGRMSFSKFRDFTAESVGYSAVKPPWSRPTFQLWWRQYTPLKRRFTSTSLQFMNLPTECNTGELLLETCRALWRKSPLSPARAIPITGVLFEVRTRFLNNI